MISIAVLMYNEEKYILDTLESIKYQIQTYGENEKIQLILSDDCSSDRTVEVVEVWLKSNQDLFCEITRIYGTHNVGTCKKYKDIINSVKGEQHVLIAGDDLFTCYNMFETLKLCNEKDIMMNAILSFDENGVIRIRKRYLNVTAQSLVTGKSIKWECKMGSPVLNGAVTKNECLTDSVLEYMCRYRLVDDRPRIYKLVTERNDISVGYINRPIIMSRKHNNSVSNVNSPHRSVHNQDVNGLFADILNNEKNIFCKFAIKCQMNLLKYRGQKGIGANMHKITPFYLFLGARILLNWPKISKFQKELTTVYADDNSGHLQNIHGMALTFARENGLDILGLEV